MNGMRRDELNQKVRAISDKCEFGFQIEQNIFSFIWKVGTMFPTSRLSRNS